MISLDEAVTARLESHGERFEVLIDPDAALAMKRGEFEGNLEDVIAAEDVFENASRGDRPAEEDLETVFGTTDPLEIIPEVVERAGDPDHRRAARGNDGTQAQSACHHHHAQRGEPADG